MVNTQLRMIDHFWGREKEVDQREPTGHTTGKSNGLLCRVRVGHMGVP